MACCTCLSALTVYKDANQVHRWYCQVTDPGLRMYNTFKARMYVYLFLPFDSYGTSFADEIYRCGIDVLPTRTHALVSQQVGRAHLVAISQDGNRGKVMQVYIVEPELQPEANYDANALFVGHHDAVLYGSARGYLFAWDKTSSRVLCGLDHGEGTSHICEISCQTISSRGRMRCTSDRGKRLEKCLV
jgi:hypothetical protein